MSDDSTTQCLLFPGIFRKPIVAQFDQREGSSDGGALLLKAADRHYDLVAGLSSCLRDERQAGKVAHSLGELVAQRVFSIACGYPDANDSARLSGDPIHKLLLDRDPIEGRELASQPTLSVSRTELGSGVTPSGCVIVPIASPSIWIRPTIPRTARSSCRSSTDITIPGATCR